MSNQNKSLKVGLVLDASLDTPDGVQQYVLDIGKWLSNQGHEVHFLVGETVRSDIPNTHSLSKNFGVRFNGNRTTIPFPTSRKKISDFLKEQNFDVLHVQIPYSPFLAQKIILATAPKTAIVGTFHVASNSWSVGLGSKILGYWVKPSAKKFDQVVSTSTASAAFAKQKFGFDSQVLPCVIEYDRFNLAKPLPAYDDEIKTILFLGRLVPRKGCELLIDAISIMIKQKNIPKFRVIICGKGPLEHHIKHMIAAKGLEQYVSMIGFVEEDMKPSYYASADISVFPSSGGESFGIVLLEAMASGRSIVLAGDNSGYSTVMAPQKELLFNPEDANELSDKLLNYLRDQPNEDILNWEQEYSKQFDIDLIGNKLIDIYREALVNHKD